MQSWFPLTTVFHIPRPSARTAAPSPVSWPGAGHAGSVGVWFLPALPLSRVEWLPNVVTVSGNRFVDGVAIVSPVSGDLSDRAASRHPCTTLSATDTATERSFLFIIKISCHFPSEQAVRIIMHVRNKFNLTFGEYYCITIQCTKPTGYGHFHAATFSRLLISSSIRPYGFTWWYISGLSPLQSASVILLRQAGSDRTS